MKDIFRMNWTFEIKDYSNPSKEWHDILLVFYIDKIGLEVKYINKEIGFFIADNYVTRKRMHFIKHLKENRDKAIRKIKRDMPIELKAELCEHMLEGLALEYRELC